MFNVASAALLSGVALALLVPVGVVGATTVMFLGVAVGIIAQLLQAPKAAVVCAVCLMCASLGLARTSVLPSVHEPAVHALLGEKVVLRGTVVDDPDAREGATLLTVQIGTIAVAGEVRTLERTNVRTLARAPAYSDVSYGDLLEVKGELALPEAFDTDTGRVFDYPHYLSVSGIGYVLWNAQVEGVEHKTGNPIFAALFAIKHAYIGALNRALPAPASGLAGGITAGTKRALGDELLEDFRVSGVVHIVVLSGYNVTIIAEFLQKMLGFLPAALSIYAGIFGIIGFAIMTGAGPSVVRASIMAVLALLARAAYRPYGIVRALTLAVLAMVLANPRVLLYDPGFQLSVLATIGLIFVSPLVEEKVTWIPEKFGLRAVVGATLGTQVTVLPLLLYQTGLLSVVALPVNLLVLVAVPMAMLFSFLAALASLALPFFAPFAGLPAYALLSYILVVVEASVQIPFAAVTLPPFGVWVMWSAYVALFFWLWRVYKKKAADVEVGGVAA